MTDTKIIEAINRIMNHLFEVEKKQIPTNDMTDEDRIESAFYSFKYNFEGFYRRKTKKMSNLILQNILNRREDEIRYEKKLLSIMSDHHHHSEDELLEVEKRLQEVEQNKTFLYNLTTTMMCKKYI